MTRTVQQIEHDLESLLAAGEPSTEGGILASYRQALANAQREGRLWAELYSVLPHGTPEWAQLAVMQALERADDKRRQARGRIREEERLTAVTGV